MASRPARLRTIAPARKQSTWTASNLSLNINQVFLRLHQVPTGRIAMEMGAHPC